MRKEWREIMNAGGPGSSTKVNVTIAAVLLAICAAFAAMVPRDIITSPRSRWRGSGARV